MAPHFTSGIGGGVHPPAHVVAKNASGSGHTTGALVVMQRRQNSFQRSQSEGFKCDGNRCWT